MALENIGSGTETKKAAELSNSSTSNVIILEF